MKLATKNSQNSTNLSVSLFYIVFNPLSQRWKFIYHGLYNSPTDLIVFEGLFHVSNPQVSMTRILYSNIQYKLLFSHPQILFSYQKLKKEKSEN